MFKGQVLGFFFYDTSDHFPEVCYLARVYVAYWEDDDTESENVFVLGLDVGYCGDSCAPSPYKASEVVSAVLVSVEDCLGFFPGYVCYFEVEFEVELCKVSCYVVECCLYGSSNKARNLGAGCVPEVGAAEVCGA